MLDNILLWNYCLSVYLVGITRRDKYNQGTLVFLALEFLYLLLVSIIFILTWTCYVHPLWLWSMLLFLSWFISHVSIKRWVYKRLETMHIEQCYERLSNKKTKAWSCFLFIIFCWFSFIIVAYDFFVR